MIYAQTYEPIRPYNEIAGSVVASTISHLILLSNKSESKWKIKISIKKEDSTISTLCVFS
jgi:hypothetical protein